MTEAQAVMERWREPGGTLGSLVEAARIRVAALQARRATIEEAARSAPPHPSLLDALSRRDTVGVIAEIKRKSPSRGEIAPGIDAVSRATEYAAGGAAAISVLTEPEQFGGSPEDLSAVATSVAIPTLRKDFIVDDLQIAEARSLGAAGVLLIARALPVARLVDLAAAAREWQIEPLIEVRNGAELEAALEAGGRIIGVNTRNLETLAVDAEVAAALLPRIPGGVVAVYESGVKSRDDVVRAAALGARAVLVGGWLSTQPDGAAAVGSLTGVPVRAAQ